MTRPPITYSFHTLPFDILSPRSFERLCLWLVEREGYEHGEHLGAAGSEQGRDVLAWRDGKPWAFQCKRVKAFGPADAVKEVDKVAGLPLKERPEGLIFIVTSDVSALARQRARERCAEAGLQCGFWTGTELDQKVKQHDDILQEFFGTMVPAGAVDWSRVDFAPHLGRLRQQYVDLIRLRLVGTSETEALASYVPLQLEDCEVKASPIQTPGKQTRTSHIRSGTWDDLVHHPDTGLLLGEAGSGKTTLLLHTAQGLARRASGSDTEPLPIYLSLSTYRGGGMRSLLERLAHSSGQAPEVLDALWRDGNRQPLCLLLDGADEVPDLHVEDLVEALDGLLRASPPKHHSLFVASRPTTVVDAIKEAIPADLHEIRLLPLDNEQVSTLLDTYEAQRLGPILEQAAGLRRVIRHPGSLTALAASTRDAQWVTAPPNIGQAYRILVDRTLFAGRTGTYDYWHVQRPILAHLAFVMVKQGRNDFPVDDELYDRIAVQLEAIHHRYEHRRTVMPQDWSAQAFLEEVLQAPVLTVESVPEQRLRFTDRSYRDYFVALYLEGIDPRSDGQLSVSAFDPEHWVDPLILLLGLNREARSRFDRLFRTQPQLAADLWFERQPFGIEAPHCIQDHFARRTSDLDASVLTHIEEPYSQHLLVTMLGSRRVLNRLRAACALTQWGKTAVDPLLDAAEDDHPIVSAVACYALLHQGEAESSSPTEKPLPPLIQVEGRSFCFRSAGACNARVGPLTLVRVPELVIAELHVSIDKLDFHPLHAPAEFEMWHTSPAWFAANWFGARQAVDWLDLAARCQWIAQHADEVARRAATRPGLGLLTHQLQLRAAAYDAVGHHLANDLGIDWQPLDLRSEFDAVDEEAEATYLLLRELYNRTTRSQSLGLAAGPRQILRQSVGRILGGGTVIGLVIQAADLRPGSRMIRDEADIFRYLSVDQSAGRMSEGTFGGLLVRELHGAPQQIPAYISYQGTLALDHASESNVAGAVVEQISGGQGGLRCSCTIDIGRFLASNLYGIVVYEWTGADKSPDSLHLPVLISKGP